MAESRARTRMKIVIAPDVTNARQFLQDQLRNTNVDANKAYTELAGDRLGLLLSVVKLSHQRDSIGHYLSQTQQIPVRKCRRKSTTMWNLRPFKSRFVPGKENSFPMECDHQVDRRQRKIRGFIVFVGQSRIGSNSSSRGKKIGIEGTNES
eukprot:m.5081 g.5081  ORF g.5081 m.5081 type:complete len:151 (+) comp12058_c0_seq1:1010-1462(+)